MPERGTGTPPSFSGRMMVARSACGSTFRIKSGSFSSKSSSVSAPCKSRVTRISAFSFASAFSGTRAARPCDDELSELESSLSGSESALTVSRIKRLSVLDQKSALSAVKTALVQALLTEAGHEAAGVRISRDGDRTVLAIAYEDYASAKQ